MRASQRPLVSVIIPTYNRAEYLPQAIGSVLEQSYPNIELIVVDDASTDRTPSLLQNYGNAITTVHNSTRKGPGASRNRGIRRSTGSLIGFLDSDDKWAPDKLRVQLSKLHSSTHSKLGLIGGGVQPIDEEGDPIGDPTFGPAEPTYEQVCTGSPFPGGTSNALIPRYVIEEVGGFDPSLPRNQDRDLWIRIRRRYKAHYVPVVTLYSRWHGDPESRPDKDIPTIRDCRLRIDSRIGDPWIRRKAFAFTWFRLWTLEKNRGNYPTALVYLGRSFLSWPWQIPMFESRVRILLRNLIPRRLLDELNNLRSWLFGHGSFKS